MSVWVSAHSEQGVHQGKGETFDVFVSFSQRQKNLHRLNLLTSNSHQTSLNCMVLVLLRGGGVGKQAPSHSVGEGVNRYKIIGGQFGNSY